MKLRGPARSTITQALVILLFIRFTYILRHTRPCCNGLFNASSSSSNEKTVSVVLARSAVVARRPAPLRDLMIPPSATRAAADAGPGRRRHIVCFAFLRFKVSNLQADTGAFSPNNDSKAKAFGGGRV